MPPSVDIPATEKPLMRSSVCRFAWSGSRPLPGSGTNTLHKYDALAASRFYPESHGVSPGLNRCPRSILYKCDETSGCRAGPR